MNTYTLPTTTALVLLLAATVHAGPGHHSDAGDPVHGDAMPPGMTHDGDGHADAMPMSPGGGGHAHGSWPAPPENYAARSNPDWNDRRAAARGAQIYALNCAACHGNDGRGTGAAAAGLDHKPADLTQHFHDPAVSGDGYLFWRVSEGGQVEPFVSSGSLMPAFAPILSERQRWDVLTYVHQLFHEDASTESGMPATPPGTDTHGDAEHHR